MSEIAEKTERSEKTERTEKMERTEKTEKTEKTERNEKTERTKKTEKRKRFIGMKNNPIYRREMTVSSRSIRYPVMIMLFNSILALVAFLDMYSALSQVRLTAEIQYSRFLELYVFVASIEFILLLGLMPALTAGSISGERERQTLELLLSTQATPLQIVTGKLFSSLSHAALMIVSSFPIIALVFVYGGIRMVDLGVLILLYIAVALFAASLGIYFSALCKKSTMATAVSYGVLLFLLIGTYVVNWFVVSMAQTSAQGYFNQVGGSSTQMNSGAFFYLLLLNPAVTFYRMISNQAGSGNAQETILQWFGTRSSNFILDAWIPVSIILWVFLAVLLLMGAVKMIDPVFGKRKKKKKKEN